MMSTDYEKCGQCSARKPVDEYYRDAHGRRYQCCIVCTDKDRARVLVLKPDKKCSACKKQRPAKQFGRAKNGRVLKTCERCHAKRILSKCEHGRQQHQCADCGGKSRCHHGKFRPQCIECVGASMCQHGKFRPQCPVCDPFGRFGSVLSGRIRASLGVNMKRPALEYLGCSVKQAHKHVTAQLTDGMTWENYGELWECDHSTPIMYKEGGLKPTLAQIIARLHYTNIQPLTKSENRSKGSRYIS